MNKTCDFCFSQVQAPHAGEEMLHRSGEAEGSHRGAPAERLSRVRHPGEDKVLPHPEESPAVSLRLLQIFQGHFTSVS